jgi:hypothetical protein
MMPCRKCGHELYATSKEAKKGTHVEDKTGPICSLCFHLEMALEYANKRLLEVVSEHIENAQRTMPHNSTDASPATGAPC